MKKKFIGFAAIIAASNMMLCSTVIADTKAPVVSVISPTVTTVPATTQKVEVLATDADGIKSVSFFKNDVLMLEDTTKPYSADINLSKDGGKTVTIKAIAKDKTGKTTSVSKTLTVKSSTPIDNNSSVTNFTSGDVNGVMMQFFQWHTSKFDSKQNNKVLWDFMREQAPELKKAGINALWIPPAYKGSAGDYDQGYGPYDHFDLGEFKQTELNQNYTETKYGNYKQLIDAVDALHANSIQVYGDIVMNHKMGLQLDDTQWEAVRVNKDNRNEEFWGSGYRQGKVNIKSYTKLIPQNQKSTFTGKNRKDYSGFQWHAKHFNAVDYADGLGEGNGYIYRFLNHEDGSPKKWDNWVSLEKGNFDYLMGSDIDYDRQDVKDEMKYWGTWFTNTAKLDGYRIDAAKHISADFMKEWLGHVRATTGKTNAFAVAEYWSQAKEPLHAYINRVSNSGTYPQNISVFDVPLHYKFNSMSWSSMFDMRTLNDDTIMEEQSAKAVTFVDNHDTMPGRKDSFLESPVKEEFKPLAYAYIMLRSKGYPCIFFPDYYGGNSNNESNADKKYYGQSPGKNYIDELIKLRKKAAFGEEKYYESQQDSYDVIGWVRMGNVPGSTGAMAVVINKGNSVKTVFMNTGRSNKKFKHYATLKFENGQFVVAKGCYNMYGDQKNEVWTGASGDAGFKADKLSASIWLEESVVIN